MNALRLTLLVLAYAVVLPASVWAQNAVMTGAVRDTTGAVLPGVTVEAASPALIEKVRIAVTDGQGLYRIVDLRPGVYDVTFSLPGFSTVQRTGVELPAGFTATLNAELRVGGLEETITVSGQSPLVDVQNVRQQTVLSREVVDSLPSSKTFASYAAVIPGAVMSATSQDVGGSREDNFSFGIHGSRAGDQRLMLDGMSFNSFQGTSSGGSQATRVNSASIQEFSIDLGGAGADTEAGGVKINLIPKVGGNTFSGYFFINQTGENLQSGNLTDDLRARGAGTFIKVKRVYDRNAGLGGPIKRDSLWFYTAHRWWGTAEFVPGMFFNKTPNSLVYTPDLSRPALNENYYRDNNLRLTWAATSKQRVGFYVQDEGVCRCFISLSGTVTPEASTRAQQPNRVTQATWSYPAGNRLLFEAGATFVYSNTIHTRQPGVGEHDIAITELSTNTRYGSAATQVISGGGSYGISRNRQASQRFSVSYITGSHEFKTGLFVQEGWRSRQHAVNDDVAYGFRNGVPVQLTQFTALGGEGIQIRMRPNLGLYAQDQWTINRLTLNVGLRFDYFNAFVPEQHLPASRFVPARDFGRIDGVPNWRDLSPRLGAAYDLFGTGKTAIKGYISRYVAPEAENLATANNPVVGMVTSTNRTWADANGNFVPDCDLQSPLSNGECGPLSDAAFGQTRITTRYADDVLSGNRGYNWQGSVAFQHELASGVSLNLGYFRTWYGNFTVTDNLAVTPADYDPYCITAPADPRLPGGGTQICGFYDIRPGKFGQVDNLVTQASNFGKQTEVYNGFDATISARFGEGGVFSGGLSTGRTVTDSCFVVDSPYQRFCRVTRPWSASTQVKFSAVYPLPWDLRASVTYQNLPGIPITATHVVTNAQIAPTLGRNLGACGTRATCNATAIVDLIEPNTQFEDRITQVDTRVSRIFRLGGVRMQGMLDAYNLFNASPVLAMNSRFGSAWLRPTQILPGRLLKVGAQVDF